MTRDDAEIMALKALAWLGRNEDYLTVFVSASGLSRDEIASRADDPEFLAAVVDFILSDDHWVYSFSLDHDVAVTTLAEARAALPGGDDVHWT